VVAQLQIARGEINVEHSARAVLNVYGLRASPGFFLLKSLAHAAGLKPQSFRICNARSLVNDAARFSFNHSSQLQIASRRAQFNISEPLPFDRALSQIIRERTRAGAGRAVSSIRAQTQINTIEKAIARHAGERGDE